MVLLDDPRVQPLIYQSIQFVAMEGSQLFGAMRATGPTTRPPHSAFHLGERLLDTDSSRLCLFPGGHPTNPLITRKGRNVLPYRLRCRSRQNGLS